MTPNPLKLDFTHAVGSRWLTYYPAYIWLLPLWLFGSVFSTPADGSWLEIANLLWINAVALAICAAEVLLFAATFWRRSRHNLTPGTPVWAVIAGGALLGISKVIVTVLLSSIVIETQQENIVGRLIASTALGIGLVVVIPLCLTQLELYRSEREILITELIRVEVAQTSSAAKETSEQVSSSLETSTAVSPELQSFVYTSLSKLATVHNQPDKLPDLLDFIQQQEIRPLSHRIWRREQERLPEFTLSNLVSVSLAELNFVLLPILLGYVVEVGPAILFGYGYMQGILALILQLSIIALVIRGVKSLPQFGLRWGIAVYFSSVVVLTALIMLMTTAIFGEIPTLLPIQASISIFLSLLTLILATGVFNLAVKKHHEIHQDLLRLDPDMGIMTLEKVERLRSDRELAQLLHSQVQNVFLSHSVQLRKKLTSKGLSLENKNKLTEQACADIEKYLRGLLSAESHVLTETHKHLWISPVLNAWEPVLNIEVSGADVLSETLPITQLNTVSDVLTEALANSLRHGLAQNVLVTLSYNEEVVTLVVEDDGVGPRQGSAGLGSYFFTALPHSEWSLTPAHYLSGSRFELTWKP
ncbi:phosphate starvation-inducible membrane PsiE [Aurantimicrobium minutum]|uniref:hypothetical protein n=1 Tax=Aurantimicrobium minutum TaxID=708131 RepID=UPI0024074BBF|nr:hypothetical protein [Aurantimicrobium minutum]MDF9809625.1 phosphate starvation-inducible membrane PsiE [Aurantimicrobium minutum]